MQNGERNAEEEKSICTATIRKSVMQAGGPTIDRWLGCPIARICMPERVQSAAMHSRVRQVAALDLHRSCRGEEFRIHFRRIWE